MDLCRSVTSSTWLAHGPVFCLRSFMHINYETLRFKALCVLDQAIDDCHYAPLRGSLGLRFALAYLYAISDGRREPFDAFWREVHDAKAFAYSEEDQHYLRTSYARTQLCCISWFVGIKLTADVNAAANGCEEGSIETYGRPVPNRGQPFRYGISSINTLSCHRIALLPAIGPRRFCSAIGGGAE